MTETDQQHDNRQTPPGEHQALPTKNIRSTRTAVSTKTAASLVGTVQMLAEYNVNRKGLIITNLVSNGNLFVLLSSEDSVMPDPTIAAGAVATRLIVPFATWEVPYDYVGRVYGVLGSGNVLENVVVTELF